MRLLQLLPKSAFNQKFVDKMYEYWGNWLQRAQAEVAASGDGFVSSLRAIYALPSEFSS